MRLILAGLVYTIWFLFGGGIDYYPNMDRLQENFAMEVFNLGSNLVVIFVLLISGFNLLLESKLSGEG